MASKDRWLLVGELMRSLRSTADLSLTGAATLFGVSKGHLSHVERGRDRPSVHLIEAYEQRFGANGLLWSAYAEARTFRAPRTAPAGAAPYPIPGDECRFVADVTVPDGTVLPPDFPFRKVWRLANAGSVPWRGRWLSRVGSPFGHGIPWSPARVVIPDTAPGETVDIAVALRSQPMGGTAQVRWRMVDDDGHEFFPHPDRIGLLLTITVDEDASHG
jgi:transcriptional regulator with XRE-family HTH domain